MKIYTANRHEQGSGIRDQGLWIQLSIPNLCGLWFIFAIILFSAVHISAQNNNRPWWYALEQGKFQFRSGAYGDALMMFEDARRGRSDKFTRMEQDFIRLLSKPDVRQFGDNLDFIENYIAENKEFEAAAALAELYHRFPKNRLNGSAKRALEEFDRQKAYPEAEYWIAETYRAEGELALAFRQYQKAWEGRTLLETPEFDTEILYQITNIHRLRREYQEMEKRAKEIIEGNTPSGAPRDSMWSGGASGQMRAAMMRILENEGVGRFLSLYRYNNTVTEKVHRLLGFFYYATGRHLPAAEHLMFSFLIQNTVLMEDTIRRDFDYNFTTLEDLMRRIGRRPDLLAFVEETEYYRTIHYLATALYASGKTRPARELWAFLAGSSNAGEWGERARRNRSPVIEKAVEFP